MPAFREAQLHHAQHYQRLLAEANDLYLRGGESVKRGLGCRHPDASSVSWTGLTSFGPSGARQSARLTCTSGLVFTFG